MEAAAVRSVTSTTVASTPPTELPAAPIPTTRTTRTTLPALDRIAFVGDSLAVNLGDAARIEAQRYQPAVEAVSDGISGCGVARSGAYRMGGVVRGVSPACAQWPDEWMKDLVRDRPKVVVIQLGRHEVLDRQRDHVWTNILEPDFAAYVRGELEVAVSLAKDDGRAVVLLTAPRFHASSADRPENDPARVDRFNELLAEVAAAHERVYLSDLGGRASPDGVYTAVVDGIRIRSDGVHYSAAGATWAVQWLLPQVIPLVGGQPR